MSLTAKATGTFENVPEGTHRAVCIMVVDLGMQWSAKWEKSTHKVWIGFETPDELTTAGEPMRIGSMYTMSLTDRAILRAHLESWRGKRFTDEELRGFDVDKLAGKPCLISVVLNGSYTNINGISSLPKKMERPTPSIEPIVYMMEDGESDTYKALPEFLRKKIDDGRLAEATVSDKPAPPANADFDDDIPF